MKVLLYRRRIDLDSGAGQLMWMQAEGLEAAGIKTQLACLNGGLALLLRTGRRARRLSAREAEEVGRGFDCVVDHGSELPRADVVFVHNVESEAVIHVERQDRGERIAREARFFAALDRDSVIVANSNLTRAALVEHHGLEVARIVVRYPGYDSSRFDARNTPALRAAARRSLGLDADTPIVGFVTSGDLDKRGLDIFLETAEIVAASEPDVRFLVVGSRRLPDWASRHPLIATGRLLHRPKSRRAERWFAALDLFLYAARFEEFGIVVLEAQALGLPVLTSRRVGAAECLPAVYGEWLIAEPASEAFADKTLALLRDGGALRQLGRAGMTGISAYARQRYVADTLQIVADGARAQKRRLR